MSGKINQECIDFIKQWEGLRTTAYQDSKGVWTIGYGHTSAAGAPLVKKGMTISKAEAEEILKRDLAKFENRVETYVKVPLTDYQRGVLVSFDYNTGAIDRATLTKKLNAGDYAAVPTELMKWVNSGGRKVQGLVNRRAAECGLWAKGEFVASNYVTAETEKQKVSGTPEAKAIVMAGAGALAAGATDAANQVAPFVEALPILRYVFIGLTLLGVSLSLWATFRRIQASNA